MSRIVHPEHRELADSIAALQLALTRNAIAQSVAADRDDLERLAQLADEEDQLDEALHTYESLIQQVPKFIQ